MRGLFWKILDLRGLKQKPQTAGAAGRKQVAKTAPQITFELCKFCWMASGGHGLQKLAGFQHGLEKMLFPERKILSTEIVDTNQFGGKFLL